MLLSWTFLPCWLSPLGSLDSVSISLHLVLGMPTFLLQGPLHVLLQATICFFIILSDYFEYLFANEDTPVPWDLYFTFFLKSSCAIHCIHVICSAYYSWFAALWLFHLLEIAWAKNIYIYTQQLWISGSVNWGVCSWRVRRGLWGKLCLAMYIWPGHVCRRHIIQKLRGKRVLVGKTL